MAEVINSTAKKANLWTSIGKAWRKNDSKNREIISVVIGQRKGGVETIEKVTFNLGDKLFLRPNSKRDGEAGLKDPDFDVCIPEAV